MTDSPTARLDQNTIVVFTSDHGDMLGCQGIRGKHVPWDESIRVPFTLRLPAVLAGAGAANGREIPLLIDAPDIMPTLLGLCSLPVPSTVQGRDFSAVVRGTEPVDGEMSALLKVPVPYHTLRMQGITSRRR
jgi:arylsulfatase A-like enzyme